MDIAPLRGLRYSLDRALRRGERAASLTAPPYDVIEPDEHRQLLDESPHNITRITLGDQPGSASSYGDRARLLGEWIESGVLIREDAPRFYVYRVDYQVPGDGRPARFVGLVALGRIHPFEDHIVLRHEQTFPRVVDDRLRLLEATGTNLESILLLYSDPEGMIERVLEESGRGDPLIRVEAKPGEIHQLHAVGGGLHPGEREAVNARLIEALRLQRPIIADGHHRYTTSLRYLQERSSSPLPGAGWGLMTFANLHSAGLAILATHRLLRLKARGLEETLQLLDERLAPGSEESWDITVETLQGLSRYRVPEAVRASRPGAAGTTYSVLHDVVIGEWLAPWTGEEPEVLYFKEGTGEREALREGRGDLLFRMRPVERDEFQRVVEGGEVFPHKTTFFYPKLWSGLVLWRLEEPSR